MPASSTSKYILIPLLLWLVVLTGCAQKQIVQVSAQAGEDQETLYVEGMFTVVSSKKHRVSLSLVQEVLLVNELTEYYLVVENGGDKPVDIGPQNVTVTLYSDYDQWNDFSIPVFSYQGMMRKIDADERASKQGARFLAAMRGLNNSMNAYNTTSTQTYGNVYSNSGYVGSYSSTSYSTTYDSHAAAQNSYQNAALLRSQTIGISASADNERRYYKQTMLKRNTTKPNTVNAGIVVADTRNTIFKLKGYYKIDVKIEDEIHTFIVDRERYAH